MKARLLIAAVVCGLLTAAWVARLTRAPGPGLSPDGMSYLGAAATIAAHHAPRVPFSEWWDEDSTARLRDYPPGFPSAIALAAAGGSLEQGGRRVEIVAGGISAALVVLIVGGVTSPLAGVVTAGVLVLTPSFVEDHSIVLSEPLYLATLLLLLLALSRERVSAAGVAMLCVVGVMVRYVGVSLAGAAALLMLLEPGPWRRRIARAAIVSAPAAVVFVTWSHWAGGARQYGWKAGFGKTLAEGWDTVQGWLVPSVAPGRPRLALALAMIAGLAWLTVRAARDAAIPLARVLRAAAILAACFAAMMIVSRLVADDAIVFDDRLLTPLLAVGVAVVAASLVMQWRRGGAAIRGVLVVLGLLWLAGDLWLVAGQVRELDEDGWGYASLDWQRSDLAQWLRTDGRAYTLYSDNPPSVYSLVHRPSRLIPDSTDPGTLANFSRIARAPRVALIGFKDPYTPENPRASFYAQQLGLHEIFSSEEGTVWAAGAGGPSAR